MLCAKPIHNWPFLIYASPPYCRNNLSINTTGQSFFLPFPVMRVMCGYCRQDTRQGSVLRFRHLRRIRARVQPSHTALLPKEPESSIFFDIFIFFLLTLPGFSSVCSFIGNWESFFIFGLCENKKLPKASSSVISSVLYIAKECSSYIRVLRKLK